MRQITKKAVTAVFLSNLILVGPGALAARFVDLSGDWTEKYVNVLSDKGVIPAEKDGKFRPNDPVTRAVLASWLVKVLGIENQPVSKAASFPDVKPTDWFYKPVEIIRQNNYISGYADGFRPNQYIQRGEVISIISRTLGVAAPDEATIDSELAKFKDGKRVPNWARTGIAEAAQAGILFNHPDPQVIAATSIATRGDTAALLYRLEQHFDQQHIADATQAAVPAPAPNAVAQPPRYAAEPGMGQPAMAQGGYQQPYGQPAPGGYPPPQQYQGQVQQGYYPAPQGAPQYGAPGGYPPQGGYAQGGYAPPQQGYAQGQYGYAPPAQPQFLQGRVAVVAAGTKFQAALKNSIDSETTQPGEEVTAVLSAPLYSGGSEAVPAGSKIIGQVTNVVSAKRFRFGANGRIDIRFTSVETPDGRRFPLSASIDSTQMSLSGGSTGGRVGKSLVATGAGAAGGAALGTALGAIVGATGRGQVGRSTGMGAAFGTALGAGVGGVGAAVRKGSEVKIPAGTALPVTLDESLQVTAGGPPPVQQPYGGYAPPVQQPYYPQQ